MRSGGARPAPNRSARAAAAPPPSQRASTGRPSMLGGLAGTMMQGMAFGAGSEVAHQAVRGMMGSGGHEGQHVQQAPDQQYQSQPQYDPCAQQNQDFMNCLQFNRNDVGACQSYLDLFKQCRGQF